MTLLPDQANLGFQMSPESVASITKLRMVNFLVRYGYDASKAAEQVEEHRLKNGGHWKAHLRETQDFVDALYEVKLKEWADAQ